MKLSICIATYNEAANISRVLDSVIEWADEVVIVDGESTDDTAKKAQSYGAKVRIVETTNKQMFHINKQMALDVATGDWILQLDADEEVTPELREEIDGISRQARNDSSIVAYQIPRKNYFLGRPLMKGGIYPDYTIRLYKKGSMHFPCKDVHENVVPYHPSDSPPSLGGEEGGGGWLGTLDNPMNHYSDPTFARYLARWGRYTTAEAQRVLGKAKIEYPDNIRFPLWKVKFIGMCLFVLPVVWFIRTYIRHKGFMDGWQGLVFHFMSAVRWWGIAAQILSKSK